MKKFVLLMWFCCFSVFAEQNLTQDIDQVFSDLKNTGSDVLVFVSDSKDVFLNNIPSGQTLLVDGMVDGVLRQFKPIADSLAKLEKTNPVNAAIVRDFSKGLTVAFKMHYELPVDASGRLYDRSDLYSQWTKVIFKSTGFTFLYLIRRGADFVGYPLLMKTLGFLEPISIFVVNNAGDIFSQGVLDAGKIWRRNQTVSFEDFVGQNYSVKNSMVSIPVKGVVSYGLGWIIKKHNIAEAAEIAALLLLNQATKKIENQMTVITAPRQHSFKVGFFVSALTSIVKSMVLTTTCKSAVDFTNWLNVIDSCTKFFLPPTEEPNTEL